MGFRMDGFLPNGKIPFLLDNCIDSGETSKAAHLTIGNKGFVISYAMSDTLLKNQKRQMAFSRYTDLSAICRFTFCNLLYL